MTAPPPPDLALEAVLEDVEVGPILPPEVVETVVERETISGLTHLAGGLVTAVACFALAREGYVRGGAFQAVANSVFALTLVAMYASSSIYHLLPVTHPSRPFYRRLDHMSIFLLIAGSYTPLCIGPLGGPLGWTFLAVIWTVAAAGLLFKIFWMDAPRWLSTSLYVAMGWLLAFAIVPLYQALPAAGIGFLVASGVIYTLGALVYGIQKPDPWPGVFGFHEIWHLFVMAGSACHFWAVLRYV